MIQEYDVPGCILLRAMALRKTIKKGERIVLQKGFGIPVIKRERFARRIIRRIHERIQAIQTRRGVLVNGQGSEVDHREFVEIPGA